MSISKGLPRDDGAYYPDDFVKHVNRDEWGLGRVLAASPIEDGFELSVYFTGCGEKRLNSAYLRKAVLTSELRAAYISALVANESFIRAKGNLRITLKGRVSRCCNCKAKVDSDVDAECVACGLLLCTRCRRCSEGCQGDSK